KITIFIQWDHRKARSEKDSSSPINSSRNANIPSPRRILTLRTSRIIQLECIMVSRLEAEPSDIIQAAEERIKNAGVTYQRLVDKAFQKQIGRNLKVYVDDLVIKSRTEHEIKRHIEETFKTLREINKKLNPKKCPFGIEDGTFLGYKVNTKGIMVCPDKVGVVLNLPSPKYLKDVQKLNGKLASLNRFLFKSAKKSLQFFKSLRKLPILIAPMEREELIVHLTAAGETYRPRTLVKGQILVDFIVERPEDDPLDTPMEAEEELPDPWTLFTDGSSCVDGLILINPEGSEFTYAMRFSFKKFSIKQVPRSENKNADALSKIASTSFAYLTKQVMVEELREKSINEAKILAVWRKRDTHG
nr:reverse transcriptase domain-containing protein [Tanacetum cinerariifolium]